jgi:hypothetical protein
MREQRGCHLTICKQGNRPNPQHDNSNNTAVPPVKVNLVACELQFEARSSVDADDPVALSSQFLFRVPCQDLSATLHQTFRNSSRARSSYHRVFRSTLTHARIEVSFI